MIIGGKSFPAALQHNATIMRFFSELVVHTRMAFFPLQSLCLALSPGTRLCFIGIRRLITLFSDLFFYFSILSSKSVSKFWLIWVQTLNTGSFLFMNFRTQLSEGFKLGFVSLIKDSAFKQINWVDTATNCCSLFKFHETSFLLALQGTYFFGLDPSYFRDSSVQQLDPPLYIFTMYAIQFGGVSYSVMSCIVCNFLLLAAWIHPIKTFLSWEAIHWGPLTWRLGLCGGVIHQLHT